MDPARRFPKGWEGQGNAHTNGDMGHVTVDVTCCSWLRHHLGDVMRHTSGSQQLPGVDGSMSVLGKHNPRIWHRCLWHSAWQRIHLNCRTRSAPCAAELPDCLAASAAALTRLPPTAPRSLRRQQRQCLLWTWPLTLFS